MKINGREYKGPRTEILVIPRQDGDIIFEAESVLNYDAFEKICPKPKPPIRMLPGGAQSENLEDPQYEKNLTEWYNQQLDWTMLKSLEATKGLEWDTVDMSDPKTYSNFKKDLSEAGFTITEISHIQRLVTSVCSLDQRKIDEATKSFLAGRRAPPGAQFSQKVELSVMQSGEPANAST